MAINKITKIDALTGAQEAEAFERQEYVKLHQSTLRKVDILANIAERTADRSLKTNATWKDKYGIHPKVIVDVIQEHWIWTAITFLAIILGLASAAVTLF